MQKSHNSKIRTSKFGFAESILSDINPVGPRWVQVSAEFPIKNHQTRINLYSKKLIIRHIVLCPSVQYKSYSRRALRALARPAYSPGRYAPRLDRLTRAFGARPRRSPSYHAANQGGGGNRRQFARPICLGVRSPKNCASAHARLYPDGRLESTPRPRAIIRTKYTSKYAKYARAYKFCAYNTRARINLYAYNTLKNTQAGSTQK